jgi:hypothetical protein
MFFFLNGSGPEGSRNCIKEKRWEYKLHQGPGRKGNFSMTQNFYKKDPETINGKAIGTSSTARGKLDIAATIVVAGDDTT